LPSRQGIGRPAFQLDNIGDGPDFSGTVRQIRIAPIAAAAVFDKLGVDAQGCRLAE